jgi:hypothetical protein
LLHAALPGPHITALLNCWNLLNKFLGSYFMRIMPWLWMFRIDVFRGYASRRTMFRFWSFDYIVLINSSVNLLRFWIFFFQKFRVWNRPGCVHIHAIDPSPLLAIAMHRVVRILFVLYLIPVSPREQLGSTGSLAENCSKFTGNAIHSMRRGAGRGKPEGPKH